MGSTIGRTAVKALTALIIIGGGLAVIPILLFGLIAAIAAAAGGGVEETATPLTLVAGEANADIKLVAVPISGVILGEDKGADGGGLFSPANLTYGYTVKELSLIHISEPTRPY